MLTWKNKLSNYKDLEKRRNVLCNDLSADMGNWTNYAEVKKQLNECKVDLIKEAIQDLHWVAETPKPIEMKRLVLVAKLDEIGLIGSKLSSIKHWKNPTKLGEGCNFIASEIQANITFSTFDVMFDFIDETKIEVDLLNIKEYLERISNRFHIIEAQ